MPRDDGEYAALLEEFCRRHGPVTIKKKRAPKPAKPPKPSAEDVFAARWAELGGEPPKRQYRFHEARKWTFDFAWPDRKLALELEGFGMGGGGGRHHLPAGIIEDCHKFNTAVLMGWRVLRVPSRGGRDVEQWVDLVRRALAAV